jgi:hypothetical protein
MSGAGAGAVGALTGDYYRRSGLQRCIRNEQRCNQMIGRVGPRANDLGLFVMSALPPKADMCDAARDVRFGPKAEIRGRPAPPTRADFANSLMVDMGL